MDENVWLRNISDVLRNVKNLYLDYGDCVTSTTYCVMTNCAMLAMYCETLAIAAPAVDDGGGGGGGGGQM